MKKVFLVFPDLPSLAEFILHCQLKNGRADSKEKTLLTILNENEVDIACKMFGAVIGEIFWDKGTNQLDQKEWNRRFLKAVRFVHIR